MESFGSGSLCAYEAPPSLWELVEKHVPEHERSEVKGMLGESLVEQSLELHEEVETLLEIWRDYKAETDQVLQHIRLPEPPAVRERLTQEICFYVESLREKAEHSGRNPNKALQKFNPTVIDYALDNSRPGSASRPSTAHSTRDGRETPALRQTPPSSARSSSASTLSEDVESISDKLNPFKLQNVADHLRASLEEEVSQLLSDIQFLQSCLDEEVEYRCDSSLSREPTLTDLREERSRLEKDLLTEEPSIPQCLQKQQRRVSVEKKPSIRSLRPSPPSLVAPTSGPLKANHRINAQVLKLDNGSTGPRHRISSAGSDNSEADMSVNGRPQGRRTNSKVEAGQSQVHVDTAVLGALCTEPAKHLDVRTADLPRKTKLVHMGSIPSPSSRDDCIHMPSPPAGNPTGPRPGSASRFRKMVLQCRDN